MVYGEGACFNGVSEPRPSQRGGASALSSCGGSPLFLKKSVISLYLHSNYYLSFPVVLQSVQSGHSYLLADASKLVVVLTHSRTLTLRLSLRTF